MDTSLRPQMLLPAAALLGLLTLLGCGQGQEAAPGEGGVAAAPSPSPPLTLLPDPDEDALCGGCHPQEVARWRGSHHAMALQVASPATVLGDFAGASLQADGVTTHFERRGEGYVVHTGRDPARLETLEIAYTFGVDPLQQYLVTLPRGRLQALTLAWDTHQRRWFDLTEGQPAPEGSPLHWRGRRYTWNSACASCHSTDLTATYDEATNTWTTRAAALNVSCAACHTLSPSHGEARPGAPPAAAPGSQAHTAAPDPTATCAPCHARRYEIAPPEAPGGELLDHVVPELLREGLFYADGQIHDEVFEYGAFSQSRMARAGVTCQDCHEPHGLALVREADALCTTCHQAQGAAGGPRSEDGARPLYPGLRAATYDSPAHHHHPQGSEGARCVSCHMPSRTYMKVDVRHDHSLRIPRPDLSERLGTPNACVSCHEGQPNAWAERAMVGWWGEGWKRPHPGEVLAAADRGDASAAARLEALVADPSAAEIVRASALQRRAALPSATRPLTAALSSPSALLRATAAEGLSRGALDAEAVLALAAALEDPVRAVRIYAASALAGVSPEVLPPGAAAPLRAALGEYEGAQRLLADQPEGHANLGVLYARQGRAAEAERAYEAAIRRDPGFFPAWSNLIHLQYAGGEPRRAEATARRAREFNPEVAPLALSHGLLLAELGRAEEAAAALAHAAALEPTSAPAHKNLGLLLLAMGRPADARAALLTAAQLTPGDAQITDTLRRLGPTARAPAGPGADNNTPGSEQIQPGSGASAR